MWFLNQNWPFGSEGQDQTFVGGAAGDKVSLNKVRFKYDAESRKLSWKAGKSEGSSVSDESVPVRYLTLRLADLKDRGSLEVKGQPAFTI